MSKTLNLVDHLLARGRHFQDLGRDHDALRILNRLSQFGGLDAQTGEETQARLAEIHLRWNRPRRARRHLTAALASQSNNAEYHFLMACAVEADPKADPARALEHYRRSLELEPDQPECLSKCGSLAVRQGQTEEGLAELRRAVELDPDDPELLQRLAKAYCQLKRAEEAESALRAAMFRNTRDSRFRKLWNDFQFEQLRKKQEASRMAVNDRANSEQGPWILPFVQPTTNPVHSSASPVIIRHDGPESPKPKFPRVARLPRRKRAQ